MGKIAKQIEKIINKTKGDILLKHQVPATDRDLALAIEKYIEDCKPKTKENDGRLYGQALVTSRRDRAIRNQALKDWHDNLRKG